MSNTENVDDVYLEQLKVARSRPAVQKARLAVLRSNNPTIMIFAFEGVDDNQIYYHWIKSLEPDILYEPFICGNKSQVLQLMELLNRDLTGLGRNIYYFVDRDFDADAATMGSVALFVTDAYSVENYIVNSSVLADILRVELCCHGSPALRQRVVGLFENVYSSFLSSTRNINLRLFISSRCGIRRIDNLPERINQIATVGLDDVLPIETDVKELVRLEREPLIEEMERLERDFKLLCPELHYRGKFALLFFIRWLGLLLRDRKSDRSQYFEELPRDGSVAQGGFSLSLLAPKSNPPQGLHDFLRQCVA